MLLTLPGGPFIYYGDEIGLRYRDDLSSTEGGYGRTGTRTPMQWETTAPNLGFSSALPSQLYLPVDASPDAPTVEAQNADPASQLHHTRRLLALRRQFPALGNDGDFSPLGMSSDERLFVYQFPMHRLALPRRSIRMPTHGLWSCLRLPEQPWSWAKAAPFRPADNWFSKDVPGALCACLEAWQGGEVFWTSAAGRKEGLLRLGCDAP